MITNNEISTLNLSPTKKDFVQIWNELLDVAGKLSERWDPTSTNESDPGIVILKALTGIADRLNYNIDKNILEAFMPTAAQEDSMRKLCEMMGYNIKYLRSATADVTIKYNNPEPTQDEVNILNNGLPIPKFTTITSSDGEISYFTTNEMNELISLTTNEVKIRCIEGQVVKCESLNDNNVITLNQLSYNNRYYLPEVQIAENGMFIYNVARSFDNTLIDGKSWKRVENLNTQSRLSNVYKFGFDSYEGRPYIEFPDDISELIGEGLFIYYTRTRGINGSVAPRALSQLEFPNTDIWSKVNIENFLVENVTASTSGSDIETIEQAYNSFKKTIGTFDTLVTCRDYMNKIYSMIDSSNNPCVSNILVTDIRNDINRAITICSSDDSGIYYKEKPLVNRTAIEFYKPIFVGSETTGDGTIEMSGSGKWCVGTKENPFTITKEYISSANKNAFKPSEEGHVFERDGFWVIKQNNVEFVTKLPAPKEDEKLISHFDLVFYPFKSYNKVSSGVRDFGKPYNSSFKYSTTNLELIKDKLEENQTIAHNITSPKDGDVVSINNYLRLNAFIATTSKITQDEGAFIIDNIKMALANAFNMRELDFGEEIPFERILAVIESADSRIKTASLNEPVLYTTFSVLDGLQYGTPKVVEYAVASPWLENDEALKLSHLYDYEAVVNYTSGDFYVEKIEEANSTGYYRIYTFANGIKKYLGISQIDVTRDKDAFIIFKDANEKGELENTDINKSFNWQYSTSEQVWFACLKPAPNVANRFFLGSYKEKDYVTVSSDVWLTGSRKTEYPVKFITHNTALDTAAGYVDFGDTKIVTKPQPRTRYKLCVVQKSLKKNMYLTSQTTSDKKQIIYVEEPTESETKIETQFKFDSTEAKKVYNKLALRNILAGRVPLFNYNDTFATNFSEGAYKITVPITLEDIKKEVPALKNNINTIKPTPENPIKVFHDFKENDSIIYTGQYITDGADGVIQYTKTYTPIPSLIQSDSKNIIQKLNTHCKIPINNQTIDDLELSAGETIKFRAPNFITTVTYPAYVNYHLALNREKQSEARPASGMSLEEILSKDFDQYGRKIGANTYYLTNWEKAFNYFKEKNPGGIKTFTCRLPISQFERFEDSSGDDKGYVAIDTSNITIRPDLSANNQTSDIAPDTLLRQSGCFKILNDYELKTTAGATKAIIKLESEWNTSDSSSLGELPNIKVELDSPFIFTAGAFEQLKSEITSNIIALKNAYEPERDTNGAIIYKIDEKGNLIKDKDGNFIPELKLVPKLNSQGEPVRDINGDVILEPVPVLPTECSWFVKVSFECLPLIRETLESWKNFIDTFLDKRIIDENSRFSGIDSNFTPQKNADGNIFYRLYSGYSYNPGKYINNEGKKFLSFEKNSFGLLPLSNSLANIYVLGDLGADVVPNYIENGSEYQLAEGEYLYINYTPSNASESASNTKTEPVNKVYSAGTIIRPSGFDLGLQDSTVLKEQGVSWTKQSVKFDTYSGNNLINLHSLGANEQIEIRDFASVELASPVLGSNQIFVYKNFDNSILEGTAVKSSVDPNERTIQYTLKEGEYIFYTDKNKKDTAYFTNGTLVTLKGVVLKRNDIIDISTILESGLQEIPWEVINLGVGSSITFTEYQYVTLGEGDKLNSLSFLNSTSSKELTDKWLPCAGEISYYASTDKAREHKITLPNMRVNNPILDVPNDNTWNGWEAQSLLEFDVSSEKLQTLRSTPKISTSLNYTKKPLDGGVIKEASIQLPTEVLNVNPIAFKTNIPCRAAGNIADKNTLNPTVAKSLDTVGFTIKSFANIEPLIVKTLCGSTSPLLDTATTAPAKSDPSGTEAKLKSFKGQASNFVNKYNKILDESISDKTDPLYTSMKTYLNDALSSLTDINSCLKDLLANIQDKKASEIIYLIVTLKDFLTKNSKLINTFDTYAKQINASLTLSAAGTLSDYLNKLIYTRCHDLSIWQGVPTQEKDYSDTWFRVNFDDIKEKRAEKIEVFEDDSQKVIDSYTINYDNALKLPVLIVDKTYGVASFYVNYTSTMYEMSTWLEIAPGYSESDFTLLNAETRWNLHDNSKWETGKVNRLYLNPGLNCIKLNKSCDLFVKASTDAQGEFYFDSLRLVNVNTLDDGSVTNGLNLEQISYKFTGDINQTKTTPEILLVEQQLLKDLRDTDIDRDFYYTVPIEKSVAIEFSKSRTNYDTLMNPAVYYDLNNVNNPFVISKLDMDYLDTGIQIARSSKIN